MVSGSMIKKLYLQLPHWMKARSVEIQAGRETCLARVFSVVWEPRIRSPPEAGSFGVKLEGSGKIRVFVIGNPIRQALIRPFHDWVMIVHP